MIMSCTTGQTEWAAELYVACRPPVDDRCPTLKWSLNNMRPSLFLRKKDKKSLFPSWMRWTCRSQQKSMDRFNTTAASATAWMHSAISLDFTNNKVKCLQWSQSGMFDVWGEAQLSALQSWLPVAHWDKTFQAISSKSLQPKHKKIKCQYLLLKCPRLIRRFRISKRHCRAVRRRQFFLLPGPQHSYYVCKSK